MPFDYRYTSSREEDDKNRIDPASFLARTIAGTMDLAQQIPGVKGVSDFAGGVISGLGKTVENAPKENALLTALYGASRPGAGVMGGVAAGLRGQNPLEGAGRAFTGETNETGADVLKQQGVAEGPRFQLGPLDVSARDIGGFAADVALDPLNLLTFGTASVARKAATVAGKAALATGRTAEEAATAARLAETVTKRARPLGSTTLQVPLTRIEQEILPFDPLSAVGRAAGVATSLMPGGDAAKEAVRRTVGQIFESSYDIKRFAPDVAKLVGAEGAPETAAGLRRIGNAPKVYREERDRILRGVADRLSPLTEGQRNLMFTSQEAGVKISDAAARSNPLDKALRLATDPQTLNALPDPEAARSLAQGEVAWRLRDSVRSGDAADLSTPYTVQRNGKPYSFQPVDLSQMAQRLGATETALGRFTMPPGMPENLVRTTGDEAVDTVLGWYQDAYRPTYDALSKRLGLRTFMDNYLKHAFPEKDQGLQRLLGEVPGAPTVRAGLRPVQQRNLKWYQRTGAAGYSEDPLVSMAAEQMDLAQKRVQGEINDFVKQTLDRYGRKLKVGEDATAGYAEYFPKGRISTFLAETLTGAGRRRLGQLLSRSDVRPGETASEAAARATAAAPPAPGVATAPGGIPTGTGTNLTRAFSVAEPGKTYEFSVEAVPLKEVVPSQLDSFAENPAYPEGLQGRMRERPASQAQVESIARRLNPDEMLLDSHRLDTGPMIVGPDLAVESGNGRTLALRRVQQESPERWAAYQRRLREVAPSYGLDPDKLPPDAVLVRKRLSEVDRIAFADEANTPPTMAMSPYEVALRDARRMPEALSAMLEVGESQTVDQALLSAANREVVKGFVSALPPNELNGISTGAGALNSLGLQRLKDALLAMTYRGDAGKRLAEAFTESIDPGVKNVEAAVYQSLPDVAKTEGLIRAGQRDASLSVTEDLAAATNVLSRLRQQGISVGDYLAQMSMFDKELSPTQETLLAFLAGASRSPKPVREFLQGYARAVQNAADPNQIGMFGQASRVTKEELVDSLVGDAAKAAREGGAAAGRAAREEGPQVVGASRLGTLAPRIATPGEVPTPAAAGVARAATAGEVAAVPPSARNAPPPPVIETAGQGAPETVDQYLRQLRALKPADRWALPAPVADGLNRIGDVRQNILLFKLFDEVQAMWKGSVTNVWPGFHVRNLMGGVVLNTEAGISDPRIYADATRIQRAASKWFGPAGPEIPKDAAISISQKGELVALGTADSIPLDELLREARLRGALQAGYFGEDIPSLLGGEPTKIRTAEKAMETLTGGFAFKPLAKGLGSLGMPEKYQRMMEHINLAFMGRVAGNTIEDNVRLTHLLGRMRLGDNLDQAIESVRKYQIDYGDLSETERKFRSFIPFYRWMRGNLPNQLERLASEPRQLAFVSKVANDLQSDEGLTDEERAVMQTYIMDRFALVTGRDEDGNPKVVSSLGLPQEDIAQVYKLTPRHTLDQWLSQLGPLAKMTLELVSGHSTFTGRAIDDENYQNAYRGAYPYIAQVPGMKDWLNMTETKVTTKDGSEKSYFNVDPWKMWLLTNVMGRLYYTSGKVLDDRKAWEDKLLNVMTGTKVTSRDVNRAAAATLRGEWGFAQQRVLDVRNTKLEVASERVLKAQGATQAVLSRQAYRKVRGDAMQQGAIELDLLQSEAERQQAEGSERKVAAMKALRDPVERALADYHAISSDDPQFADDLGQPDIQKFLQARDAYLAQLEPGGRQTVQTRLLQYIDKLPPNAAKMEREYQGTLASYKAYQSLPPFTAPVTQSNLERMRDLNKEYLAQADAIARARYLTRLPGADRSLLTRYFSIRQHPSMQRVRYEKGHPELQMWGFVR